MRSLHSQRHAYAKSSQCYHRRRAHADEHHLPKDRRNFKRLPDKGCDEHPVKQTRVKLDNLSIRGITFVTTRRMTRWNDCRKSKVERAVVADLIRSAAQ